MTRRTTLVIFLVALAVRLVYLAVVFEGPESLRAPDSKLYESAAAGLVTAGKLVQPGAGGSFVPVTERVPGYIVYLAGVRALFGPSPIFAILGQALLDALACVLVGWIAHFLSRRIGFLAGMIAAFNTNMIVHMALVLTESLFLLTFAGAMLCTVSYMRTPRLATAAGAGLLVGLAMLVRPVLMFYPPILVLFLLAAGLRSGQGWRPAVAQTAAAMLWIVACVAPLMVKNHRDYGHAELVSQTGTHALNWLVPLAREYGAGVPPSETRADLDKVVRDTLVVKGLSKLPDNPFEASALQKTIAFAALRDSGVWTLVTAWSYGAAINLFAPAILSSPLMQNFERRGFFETPGVNPAHKAWNFLAQNAWFSVIVIAAAAFTLLARLIALPALLQIRGGRLRAGPSLYMLATAAYVLAVTGPITGVKYRLPLEPCLDIFLAAGLIWMVDRWWRGGRRPEDAET